MARKTSQNEPSLAIQFFNSGFFTYRSALFAPFKNIGINVVSFHDPVIDGANFELTDKLEWTRRSGFSRFCPISLPDTEIVRDFYSTRNLNGTVIPFVDTSIRLATFSPNSITTILTKSTTAQGYVQTVGNRTYFADGASADLASWDGTQTVAWGLAAPTITPLATGMGFWQPFTKYALGNSILDPNGCIETVTSILLPNGSFESPTAADQLTFAGSLSVDWTFDPVNGGYVVVDGYKHIQQTAAYSGSTNSTVLTLNPPVMGNVLIVNFGIVTQNFTPSVVSVTDNYGNTYSQQATGTGTYHGGGGNNFISTEWVYSAPVTATGGSPLVITVTLNVATAQATAHEFQGISASASTSASNYVVNGPATFDTGTATFSGTQLAFSGILLASPVGGPVPPPDYTSGAAIFGAFYIADAYFGETTTATPDWTIPASDNLTLGLTVVFPISTLAVGYTPYLFLHDFNLNIPSGATVLGIVVNIPKFNAGFGVVQDQSVKLVIGGAVVGVDHAAVGPWNQGGYTVSAYGNPGDTWGVSPTAAELNANGLSGFGIAISADIINTSGGSVIPEVGFVNPNQVTVTVYFQQSGGRSGPGISGANEPIWSTYTNIGVNDGGLTWTNYGPIETWFPVTGYPTPVVILDPNGNLQLSTYLANPIPPWEIGDSYTVGEIVYFGGNYWVALADSTGVVPSNDYATTGADINQPYWALTTTPLVTGINPPVWNTTIGGMTTDGSYTWTNIGQGTGLAFTGYAYVYGFRTVYGHLTTCSPYSNNTGAILGPVNATITSYTISGNVVTFTGNNNFIPGNVFQASELMMGTFLNLQNFTVISAVPSESLPLTEVAVSADVLTITANNNLTSGQKVTFTGVGSATFLNGVTVTVLPTGLSATQFEANLTHANYGPTGDTGNVQVNGSYSASFTHADVGTTLDTGVAIPLIATIAGMGTASPLCNSVANITAVSVSANIVTVTASNNFQPGLWVTFSGLTSAAFLNAEQLQVISVDQPVGTQNTQFQVEFITPNYTKTPDSGTATFNGVEIYRTSDGGGTYLFDGAVTNPGANGSWIFDDFVVDADLDILLVAPLNNQNDPPPGAPGSTITPVGNVMAFWQGRLWLAVGNYVYMDAGPDCTNGVPEESWPPAYRFQFSGPVFGLEPTADGVGLLVYLADRVNVILGGPETISFYPTDALSNFGISNSNSVFRDGSIIGQFTTQRQYFELIDKQKDDIGNHIGDYLADNFDPAKSYVTMHRNGLDVGVFISNGVDQILRFGSNIQAWSVPAFPACGAGALASIETSVGIYSLMLASPMGGKTAAVGPFDPHDAASIAPGTPVWANPENITLGDSTYATATFTGDSTSQILRASAYGASVPDTSAVMGVTLILVGNQTTTSDFTITVTPTIPGGTSHTFQFGLTDTTVTLGGPMDLWNLDYTWSQPINVDSISFDITATYSGPTPGESGIWGTFDKDTVASGLGTTASVGPITPAAAGEVALVIGSVSSGAMGTPSGWQILDNSSGSGASMGAYVQIQSTASPFTFSHSLGGSFSWDLVLALFASGATSFTANITSVAVDGSNIVTVTCNNDFVAGTQATCSGLSGAVFLNGVVLTILTRSATQFTAALTHVMYGPTADSGVATDVGIVQSASTTPGNNGAPSLTFTNAVQAGNTVVAMLDGINLGGFGDGYSDIQSISGDIASVGWTIINSQASGGNKPHANLAFIQNVTAGGSTVQVHVQDSVDGARYVILELAGGSNITTPVASITEAQVIVTYQNPGNFLYARDLNSWGDGGQYGQNNGQPYDEANIVIGSISLSEPGAPLHVLQHIVGYFDAVGTLHNGSSSYPDIWVLPNEINDTQGVGFVYLPEIIQEPPIGQNHPSKSLLALRWPVDMANSEQMSQFIHHMQIKIQFEPENAPNTIKALSFMEQQNVT